MEKDYLTGIANEAEKAFPAFWPSVYPRSYNEPAGFSSPRHLAADLLGLLVKPPVRQQELGGVNLLSQFSTFAAVSMAALSVPVFFVGPDLLQALALTSPPDRLRWDEMKLPFDACSFMLPRGSLVHPTVGECRYIWYARLNKSTRYQHPFDKATTFGFESAHFVVRMCFGGDGQVRDMIFNQIRNPTFSHLGMKMELVTDVEIEDEVPVDAFDSPPAYTSADAKELELFYSALTLTVNLLLVMVERPQIVERSRPTGKRTKKGTAFWTPNFIGQTYRLPKAVETSTEPYFKLRLHWRRGHWRSQPHGLQSSLRRLVWIEPVLVGGQ